MTTKLNTIVLVHGLWLTPRSWENFRSLYEAAGYQVLTPTWPGESGEVEELRRDASAFAGVGVQEIADHHEKFLRTLDEPPILMGHSFGGLIVQILLDRGLGAAGVAIDPAPPKGILRLPLPALRSANAILSNPFNVGRTVMLTFEQFVYGFANVMSERDARAAYERYAVPGPGRPVFQVALANLNPWSTATRVDFRNADRAPLLLIGGSEDHQVPISLVRDQYKKHARSEAGTDFKEFPNRSHLICGQEGWQEVAQYALSWARTKVVQTTLSL